MRRRRPESGWGALTVPSGSGIPPVPAVARLAGHGHLLIAAENQAAAGARSLLQALTLRLAVATRPGTVRFALADPLGQGEQLSGFLRLPAALRVGSGVASSAAEIEALLKTLTDHVVEVTQTRLTNVYDSVEAYNAASTGVSVPYHVLVLAGFPGGISDAIGRVAGPAGPQRPAGRGLHPRDRRARPGSGPRPRPRGPDRDRDGPARGRPGRRHLG